MEPVHDGLIPKAKPSCSFYREQLLAEFFLAVQAHLGGIAVKANIGIVCLLLHQETQVQYSY